MMRRFLWSTLFGAMICQPSFGSNVIDSGGFEGNTSGGSTLVGQTVVTPSGQQWQESSLGTNADVQSTVVNTGSNAVQFSKNAPSGQEFVGIQIPGGFDPVATPLVTLSWDMYLPDPGPLPPGATFGPIYGAQASDTDSSVANFLLGFVGVDALAGAIWNITPFSIDQVLDPGGSAVTVPFDRWNNFTLELDYGTDSQSIFVNGSMVNSLRFTDSSPSQFNTIGADLDLFSSAEMAVYQAPVGTPPAFTGTAYYDNFSVSAVLNLDNNLDGKVDASDLAFACAEGNLEPLLEQLGVAPGDADGANGVDFRDFAAMARNFGRQGAAYTDGDFDCSGRIDFRDFAVLARNFGRGRPAAAAVPEPETICLLGWGLVVGGIFRVRRPD